MGPHDKFPPAVKAMLDVLKAKADANLDTKTPVQVKLGSYMEDIFLEFDRGIVRLVMPVDQAEQIGKAMLYLVGVIRDATKVKI